MMFGMLIAILSYRPIYKTMYETTDISKKTEILENPKETTENKENGSSIVTTEKIYRWYIRN